MSEVQVMERVVTKIPQRIQPLTRSRSMSPAKEGSH